MLNVTETGKKPRGFFDILLLRCKIWRRRKTKFFKVARTRVIDIRTQLVIQWADEAFFEGQVTYFHKSGKSYWRYPDPIQEATGSFGHIAIGRHAFYEPIGAKSIFYHELGHSALGSGDEVAATQAGIRWAQKVLLEPSPIVNDLTKYIRYLEGR